MADENSSGETRQQDSNPASRQQTGYDFRDDREIWKAFYQSDGKHEANISLINRQLTVIQSDIKNLDSKIDSIEKTLASKMDSILVEFKISTASMNSQYERTVALQEKDRSLIKGICLATLFALIAVLFTLWFK